MVALTAARNTPEALGVERTGTLGATQTIFNGSILMRNGTGDLIKGVTATGAFGVGRAETANVSVSAGVTVQRYRSGIFKFANSSAGDLIAKADIGAACFIVDDQTVAKTNGTNTRSPAGAIDAIDPDGSVWVRFDEALTRALLS